MSETEIPKGDKVWWEYCMVCKEEIKVMAFRGTGVCCDNHRKQRDGDDKAHLRPVVYHKTGFRKEPGGGNLD